MSIWSLLTISKHGHNMPTSISERTSGHIWEFQSGIRVSATTDFMQARCVSHREASGQLPDI